MAKIAIMTVARRQSARTSSPPKCTSWIAPVQESPPPIHFHADGEGGITKARKHERKKDQKDNLPTQQPAAPLPTPVTPSSLFSCFRVFVILPRPPPRFRVFAFVIPAHLSCPFSCFRAFVIPPVYQSLGPKKPADSTVGNALRGVPARRSIALSASLLESNRRRRPLAADAPVAQLDSASVFGTEGCRFESCRAYSCPSKHLGRSRSRSSDRSLHPFGCTARFPRTVRDRRT